MIENLEKQEAHLKIFGDRLPNVEVWLTTGEYSTVDTDFCVFTHHCHRKSLEPYIFFFYTI